MKQTKTVRFKISSIDSLAQGVSKGEDGVVFITKVLEGEEGEAKVYKSKKNISFATLASVKKASQFRVTPECEHFDKCGGCQLLHTDYDNELTIKKNAIIDIFERQNKIPVKDLFTQVRAPRRNHYRNRVQLHYNKKQNKIGFHSDDYQEIIEVKNCQVILPALKDTLQSLYEKDWKRQTKKTEGHLEVYLKNNNIVQTWDSRYAHEGFSQVFEEMNEQMLELIDQETSHYDLKDFVIIDLFGGNGNLTKNFSNETIVIDGTPEKYIKLTRKSQQYHQLNLYSETAPSYFEKLWTTSYKNKNSLLVIDPPRSGIKNIESFTQVSMPKYIIYVSCNAQTLARDLKTILNQYQILKLIQLDFFPGTKHFETVIFLIKNEQL